MTQDLLAGAHAPGILKLSPNSWSGAVTMPETDRAGLFDDSDFSRVRRLGDSGTYPNEMVVKLRPQSLRSAASLADMDREIHLEYTVGASIASARRLGAETTSDRALASLSEQWLVADCQVPVAVRRQVLPETIEYSFAPVSPASTALTPERQSVGELADAISSSGRVDEQVDVVVGLSQRARESDEADDAFEVALIEFVKRSGTSGLAAILQWINQRGSSDFEIVHRALFAIAGMRDPDTANARLELLLRSLQHRSLIIRDAAGSALVELGDQRAATGLSRAIQTESSPEVRRYLTEALAEIAA